ncbi:uncharacterized protein LOC134257698 [Saccostrea cucullata]|uniref:uncharacterized protein LOC134257698 n=1 Tax=Saccostrea cuccullata TaxID=36930 RepID=UPI002ED488E1
MAGGFSICVSVLWVVYVLSTHFFYYEKLNSKFFGLDGILKKPYDGNLASDNAFFTYVQVYPLRQGTSENQTDHAHSSNSNQLNHDFNISRNRQENNERPRRSRPIAQCTEICTGINDQHVLVCNGQHIPRQLLNLPPPPPPVNIPRLSSTAILENPPMQTPDTSVVGEFLTIMAYTMTEDVCLRTMLRTSLRIVDQVIILLFITSSTVKYCSLLMKKVILFHSVKGY